jgi:class 3 adenylate cyclase/tetratricopeptide (TPR) repeat protein
MDALSAWLQSIGLERYAPVFVENGIDLDSLILLTEIDLEKLGVLLGHRRKLLKAIAELSASGPSPPLQASLSAQPVPIVAGERRQLTVLFCDLVGSTELARRLDAEDLAALMREYRAACTEVVTRYEGNVAQHLGDGVMVYFGWPRAHEDDPERAVRAALEIVAKVKIVTASSALSVRIGVATGSVVVGEGAADGHADASLAVGETPNLAARLQGLAGADEIVIAPSTRRLLGDAFEVVDLGGHSLKGFAEPVRAWRIAGAGKSEDRFEAIHGRRLTPFIGRDEEVALLLRRWRQAQDGEGQVVLLSGEPGIGKSRILHELRVQASADPHIRLHFQCSPYHVNSVFHPLIDQFERGAGFAREDSTDTKLDKLEAYVERAGKVSSFALPLFAAMLSLPNSRYAPLEFSPQRQKEETIKALGEHLTRLSSQEPVLLLFEDAHWIDASSLEVLDMAVQLVQRLRVLIVVTFRPEFESRWTQHSHVTLLTLNRLARKQAMAMVDKVTGGKALPPEILEQIVAKTDGMPLFVEELTSQVVESGLLHDTGDRYVIEGPLPPLALPATLQDSLLARLDRLAPVKSIAQIGACIGREFSHELLATVAAMDASALEDGVAQLMHAGLIFRSGVPPAVRYVFKHALVQEAAYNTLLKSRRQQLHAAIAAAYEKRFSADVVNAPEILAHHLTEAGLAERAVPQWLAAGQRAIERVATRDAVRHLERALAVNELLPAAPERGERELDIRLLLAAAHLMLGGWAALDVTQTLAPARSLAMMLDDRVRLPKVLHMLWMSHAMRERFAEGGMLLEELHAAAVSSGDSSDLVLAWTSDAIHHCFVGQFLRASQSFKESLAIYDKGKHGHLVKKYGWDPKCSVLLWAAAFWWTLGYPDRARQAAIDQLAHARELGHAWNLGWCLSLGTTSFLLCGDTVTARAWLTEMRLLGQEHALAALTDVELPLHEGSLLIGEGNDLEGYATFTRGCEIWERLGWSGPIHRGLIRRAEALCRLGRIDEALPLIEDALQRITQTGAGMEEAEAHRIKGELLAREPGGNAQDAEAAFVKSLDVARAQNAKGWELRTATSLARFWSERGKRKEAYDLLSPIYDWFTEGFDTRDLKAAKLLLDELR